MIKKVLFIHGKRSFTARVLAYRSLSAYQKSFQYRILNYFDSVQNIEKVNQPFEISTQIRENFGKSSVVVEKYKSICKHFEQLLNTKNQNINRDLINHLDKQCCSLIHLLRHSEILSLLNAFLKLTPNKFITTNFYNKSIPILFEALESELLNSNQLVQLFFFLSSSKNHSTTYIKHFKSYLTNLNDLPLIEKCIVAQAFYKSSAKLETDQSKILEKVIENECNDLIVDQVLLASICKAIRISGVSEDLELKPLSQAIINSEITFTFTTIVHLLCLYAEALILESEVINKLIEDSIQLIREDSIKSAIRLKDFDRFLWSISYLGLNLSLEQRRVLQTYFEQRLQEYKNKENLGILVNSMLCLHMLECWNKKIIQSLLEENTFLPVFYEKFHWKIRARLQLLISQIFIEMKLLVPKPLKKQIKINFCTSEYIHSIAQIASSLSLSKNGIIKNVTIECPIYALQIPGVTLNTEKGNYHIDVLDNTTCLRNTNVPHGLMKLKIRLLSILKYCEITISNELFQDTKTLHSKIEQQIINSVTREEA